MNRYRFGIIGILLAILIYAHAFSADVFRTGDKLTMELEEVALPVVLNMIAKQYDLNLVLSNDVSGEVTLRLNQVDIQTALEALLYPNGYNYYIKDDIIIVKAESQNAYDELQSDVITLHYIDPSAAVKALEAMKSDKGKIIILNKQSDTYSANNSEKYSPNSIFITDYPSVVKKMLGIIEQMDVEEKLISIKVRIIETKVDAERNVGLSWPTSVTTGIANSSSSSTGDATTTTTDGTTDQFSLSKNLNNGGWTWGTLSVSELQTVLHLLEQNGNSKLLSDPHITTLENHQAEIRIETVIPIQTINRFTEAAATQDIVTFYDEEVGISLIVTPRINGNGKITLDVQPKIEDIIGFSGTEGQQKPITSSRSVDTRITVLDGETAVLGGLLKENKIEQVQKVPFLGHIPLLGGLLFTKKSEETETSDLIIMITPTIVQ